MDLNNRKRLFRRLRAALAVALRGKRCTRSRFTGAIASEPHACFAG